jgi:hypothetical protein
VVVIGLVTLADHNIQILKFFFQVCFYYELLYSKFNKNKMVFFWGDLLHLISKSS